MFVYTLYNIAIKLVDGVFHKMNTTGLVKLLSADNKLRKFIEGQNGIIAMTNHSRESKPTIWIHAASFGEFGVARPIVRQLRKSYHIVLTFFSSTGYEATRQYLGTSQSDADEIYYLPLDTSSNAMMFVRATHPEKVIFIISELWPNYLFTLKELKIPTYLVSAKISTRSSVMRWYGGLLRKSLQCFTHIICLDDTSKLNLKRIGISNVTVMGDPLFDNAVNIANREYHNSIIERFCEGKQIFIAGSIHDKKDLELVSYLANKNPNDKFIFVPHEIHEEGLRDIKYHLKGKCKLYSSCDDKSIFFDVQVLVIDFLGALASIYRFGTYAYVGGGFTPFLHSVIEATVYGLPVAFGPETRRKTTPQQLQTLGIGKIVHNGRELNAWYRSLKGNQQALATIREKAIDYTNENQGATNKVLQIILRDE